MASIPLQSKESWQSVIAIIELAVSVILLILGIIEGVFTNNVVISLLFLAGGILLFLPLIPRIVSVSGQASGGIGSAGPFLLILFAIALLGGGVFVLYKDVISSAPEYQIGIIIVLGSGLLLVLLFIMSTGFKFLGLADPAQALGLPEGSIRSLIALLLILIFIMMGVFLFREASGRLTPLRSLSAAQLGKLPQDKLISVSQSTSTIPTYKVVYRLVEDEITSASTITLTAETLDQIADLPEGAILLSQEEVGTAPTYDAIIRTEISADGADMGKQLLTTVGTLVVAVAGFYFGTRAVATARGESTPTAPTIRYIYPATGSIQKGEVQIDDLSGSGFADKAEVRLRQRGQNDIKADDVNIIGQSKITCKFKLAGAKDGDWDVLVINPNNLEGILSKGFVITP